MVKRTISTEKIERLTKKVAEEANKDGMSIAKAFVFGSYAKKTMTRHSDLDLCFIFSKVKDTIKAEAYLRTRIHFSGIKLGIPIDLVVYKEKEFKKEKSPLLEEIRKNGVEIPIN